MSNEAYAIRCDAQHGASYGIEYTFMVDRKRSTSTWWTSDDESILMVFRTHSAAVAAASRIRYNNPVVVSAANARETIRHQRDSIMEKEISDSMSSVTEDDF